MIYVGTIPHILSSSPQPYVSHPLAPSPYLLPQPSPAPPLPRQFIFIFHLPVHNHFMDSLNDDLRRNTVLVIIVQLHLPAAVCITYDPPNGLGGTMSFLHASYYRPPPYGMNAGWGDTQGLGYASALCFCKDWFGILLYKRKRLCRL